MKSFKMRNWQKPFLLLALIIGLVPVAFYATAPLELEGGALYIEAADTTLTFEVPDDGIVFVGCEVFGYAFGEGFYFLVDNDTVALPAGGAVNSAQSTTIMSITKGNHHFHAQQPYYTGTRYITSSRIWVLFWPKKTVAVSENPGIPPIMMLATLCRAGTPISLPQGKTAVYDATGKLVERPSASWTPTEAGIFFVQSGKQAQKVTVIK